MALISKGEEAISWGNRLFDHYMQKATPVKIGSEEIQDEIVVME
ncbi:transcriptional regulator FilR1 domain-containing protein [Methanobacterium formicicum]